jgi:hypothetical protein
MGAVGQVQLAQNIADMALARIFADHQTLQDLSARQPLRNQLEYLNLTVGELGERIGRQAARALCSLSTTRAATRGCRVASPRGPLDGGSQLIDLDGLEQVGDRPSAQGREDVVIVVMGGQHHYLGARAERAWLCGATLASASWAMRNKAYSTSGGSRRSRAWRA